MNKESEIYELLPRDDREFKSLLEIKKTLELEPNMYKKWLEEAVMDYKVGYSTPYALQSMADRGLTLIAFAEEEEHSR